MAVTGAFFSCTNNDADTFTPNLQSNEISFKTLRDKVVSRNANDSASNFQVYGNIAGQSAWYINDVYASKPTSVEDSVSIDGKVYYWPGVQDINFYAFAPDMKDSKGAITAVTATAGATPSVKLSYTVPQAANMDLTIATPVTQNGGTSKIVPLKFQHALSKITLKIELAEPLKQAGYSMSDTIGSIIYVGNTGGNIDAAASTLAWETLNGTAGTYKGDSTYMVMPQTATDVSVEGTDIKIYCGTGANKILFFKGNLLKYTLKTGDIKGDKLEPGKWYNMILTISDLSHDSGNQPIFNGKIKFTSQVADWDPNSIPVDQP